MKLRLRNCVDAVFKSFCSRYFIVAVISLSVVLFQLQEHYSAIDNQNLTERYSYKYTSKVCDNGGLYEESENGIVCKCQKNYYGENCTHEIWTLNLLNILGLDLKNADQVRGEPKNLWTYIPFTYNYQLRNLYMFFLEQAANVVLYVGTKNYLSLNSEYVKSSRLLPPNIIHIQDFHYTYSRKVPPLSTLYSTVFQRPPKQFIPDPEKRNLLFLTFYQYFVLQFFNTDSKLEVTASQLYGSNLETIRQLRTFVKGKLKTEHLNGEDYPPYLSSVKRVHMVYPKNNFASHIYWFDRIIYHPNVSKNQNPKWAMGHPLLSMNPLLFAMSTLWIREHNRVCNILVRKWPKWSDERLYDTTKLIIIGEMITIMASDVMNVHTKYSLAVSYKPNVLHNTVPIIENKGRNTPDELLFATMWPSSLPDDINGTDFSTLLFSNNRQLFVDGLSATLQLMVNHKMGMVTYKNDGAATEPLTKLLLKLSREQVSQRFNNYRRHLGLKPYKNFYSLTKDKKMATQLKNMYDNIENVELIPGMLAENHKTGNTPPTYKAMSNNLIMGAILSSPIGFKHRWKQETFGGPEGFAIVKSANIEKLICYNLADNCKDFKVNLRAK